MIFSVLSSCIPISLHGCPTSSLVLWSLFINVMSRVWCVLPLTLPDPGEEANSSPLPPKNSAIGGGISSIWWVPWHNWCWSCWQIGSVHNVLFKMFCSQYVVQNVLFTICCSHASLKPTDRVWSVRSVAAEKAGKKVNSFFENKTCVATHFKVTFCRAELSSKKEIS